MPTDRPILFAVHRLFMYVHLVHLLFPPLKAAQATGVVKLELAPALFLIKKVWFLLY